MNTLFRCEPEDDDDYTYVVADSLGEALNKYKQHVVACVNAHNEHADPKQFPPITVDDVIDPQGIEAIAYDDYLVV